MSYYLKAIIFITLLVGTLALEELDHPIPHSDCPKVDDINHSVLLPHPLDCSKYYSCVKGLAYAQKCPNNLHWSPSTYRCDYPEIAKCQSFIKPTSPLPPVTPKTHSTIDIFYELSTNDCNKYYECQSRSCPPNYHWNAVAQKCDFPHLAHCPFVPVTQPPVIISTAATVPTTIVTIPTAPTVPPTLSTPPFTDAAPIDCPECQKLCEGTNHIYLPYEKDCHKFIQCNGWEYIQTCPDNLFWNAKLNTCDRFCIPM